jgi:hypothetical protein
MQRTLARTLASLTLACGLAACGAAQRANTSGDYRGPNQLDFEIRSPVRRVMPPERNQGSAEIIDSGADHVVLELRIFGDGETPCRVHARVSHVEHGRMDILPGQRCASRFRYDGRPVAAMTQIDRGIAHHDTGRLRIAMQGPFVADVLLDGRVVPVEGYAVWQFEGWR